MLQGVWLVKQLHLEVDDKQISCGILTKLRTTYDALEYFRVF